MTDKAKRWFIIGRQRYKKEVNLEKMVKTIRNLKLLNMKDRDTKAKLVMEAKNIIDVDLNDVPASVRSEKKVYDNFNNRAMAAYAGSDQEVTASVGGSPQKNRWT